MVSLLFIILYYKTDIRIGCAGVYNPVKFLIHFWFCSNVVEVQPIEKDVVPSRETSGRYVHGSIKRIKAKRVEVEKFQIRSFRP